LLCSLPRMSLFPPAFLDISFGGQGLRIGM
jgi:hypothetical protein